MKTEVSIMQTDTDLLVLISSNVLDKKFEVTRRFMPSVTTIEQEWPAVEILATKSDLLGGINIYIALYKPQSTVTWCGYYNIGNFHGKIDVPVDFERGNLIAIRGPGENLYFTVSLKLSGFRSDWPAGCEMPQAVLDIISRAQAK